MCFFLFVRIIYGWNVQQNILFFLVIDFTIFIFQQTHSWNIIHACSNLICDCISRVKNIGRTRTRKCCWNYEFKHRTIELLLWFKVYKNIVKLCLEMSSIFKPLFRDVVCLIEKKKNFCTLLMYSRSVANF